MQEHYNASNIWSEVYNTVFPIFHSILPFGVLTLGTQLIRFGYADLSSAEQLLEFKELVDSLQNSYNHVKNSMQRVYVVSCCCVVPSS